MPLPLNKPSTSVTITNPLVLYRALVTTKRIDPDPTQHRLALHLQKLYFRLKDYEPEVAYGARLKKISNAVGNPAGSQGNPQDELQSQSQANKGRNGVLSAVMQRKRKRETLEMTRVLTSQESALSLDSPRGLLLHGEVGTGKSMLVDLLADCLPTRKKKRWHFNTFMLETIARFEQLRREQSYRLAHIETAEGAIEEEYSMLRLARDMISTSPILFLDEFQLPDRAASKILSNLLTSFFHLGGVLIATSNRMPEELAKASGVEFVPPPSRYGILGDKWRGMLGKREQPSGGMFAGKSEFAGFLDVLRARCEVWDMEGERDWRRREAEDDKHEAMLPSDGIGFGGLEGMKPGNLGLGYEQSTSVSDVPRESSASTTRTPKNYFVLPQATSDPAGQDAQSQAWDTAVERAVSLDPVSTFSQTRIPWAPFSVRVYGRSVLVPRSYAGVSLWTFAELCGKNLGPADYITLASTFHTLILADVPVLGLLQKNEARRLITLLDALYEARCKLLIRAEAGPDDLFFPESTISSVTESPRSSSDTKQSSSPKSPSSGSRAEPGSSKPQVSENDATYSETISEIEQDLTAPFRPNISTYSPSPETSDASFPFSKRSILADEDSDFGPLHPNSHDQSQRPQESSSTSGPKRSSSSFTGEDEMFAYKRARSRLWEMCGTTWWNRGSSEDGQGWWRPLPSSVRRWERDVAQLVDTATPTHAPPCKDSMAAPAADAHPEDDVGKVEREGRLFRHGASPFRTSPEPPPKFSWVHAWGMMKWGGKAGRWGKGVDGLQGEVSESGAQGVSDARSRRRKERGQRTAEKTKADDE